MSIRKGDEPAFPVSTRITGQVDGEGGHFGHQDGESTYQFPGMSLRDWFAGQALMGFLSEALDPERGRWNAEEKPEVVARAAYRLADAMLATREEG